MKEKSFATLRDRMTCRCCYCQRPCTGVYHSDGRAVCQWCWKHGGRDTEAKRIKEVP